MNISFANKTVIITGGTSGIGKATALQFLDSQATVIVVANTNSIPKELEDKGQALHFVECDVSKSTQVREAFCSIGTKFGSIDTLVNNVGIQTYGDVVSTSESEWDLTLNTNLKSIYLCSGQCIPFMEEADHPVIINVGSAQGFVSQEKVAAYSTSKEAIHGLTRSMAVDFAPRIRCLAVCPGAVMTPMLVKDLEAFEDKESILEQTRNIHLLRRIAEPEEIANFIVFMASDKASFATGHTYRVDGGIGLKIGGT